jgi:hypothetical protein
MIVGEVVAIGFLAICIPFGRKHTTSAYMFEAFAQSPDSGKEINEAKPARCLSYTRCCGLLKEFESRAFKLALARLVSVARTFRHFDEPDSFIERKASLLVQSCECRNRASHWNPESVSINVKVTQSFPPDN